MSVTVLINSFLFALGLAFESFMVALANGLNNANVRILRAFGFAVMFAACHAIALFAGYSLVFAAAKYIAHIERFLTWIAVGVLATLGVNMILEGLRARLCEIVKPIRRTAEFFVQSAVASFDAFAVGLTVPNYSVGDVAVCAAVIFSVIAAFYTVGFVVGKKCGTKFSKYAAILGGLVFVGVAVEIAVGAF
ncbi:MAG: manganese efflux pump MntP family protein [Clostridiales bacterium]|nr:manganese efflux pump MntP family protein [Clostridiales bacterium]